MKCWYLLGLDVAFYRGFCVTLGMRGNVKSLQLANVFRTKQGYSLLAFFGSEVRLKDPHESLINQRVPRLGGFNYCDFHPDTWGNDPNLTSIFFNWVVPASFSFLTVFPQT